MKAKLLVSLVAMAALGLACTEATPPPRSASSAAILEAPVPSTCALGMPGALVVFEETPRGAALTFKAEPEHLAELRERAQYASAMHGPGQKVGKGHDGKHGNGGHHGLKAMQMPPAYAGEEDIEGGARISFTPVDANDIDVLRAKLKVRAQEMMSDCHGVGQPRRGSEQ